MIPDIADSARRGDPWGGELGCCNDPDHKHLTPGQRFTAHKGVPPGEELQAAADASWWRLQSGEWFLLFVVLAFVVVGVVVVVA